MLITKLHSMCMVVCRIMETGQGLLILGSAGAFEHCIGNTWWVVMVFISHLIAMIQDLVMVLLKMEIFIVMISLLDIIKALHLLQKNRLRIYDSTGMLDLQKIHSMKMLHTMVLNFFTKPQIKERTGKPFQVI